LLSKLINKLPDVIGFRQTFDPQSDTGAIWKGMRDKTRNVIRRSQDLLQVSRSRDGISMAPERERLQKILKAAVANEAGMSLLCRTACGEVAAAIFVVWDDRYCHYPLSRRNERITCNGALSLLLWDALQFWRDK
jgi:hypothetical protein